VLKRAVIARIPRNMSVEYTPFITFLWIERATDVSGRAALDSAPVVVACKAPLRGGRADPFSKTCRGRCFWLIACQFLPLDPCDGTDDENADTALASGNITPPPPKE
jgi:hypothetical protein